MRKAALLLKSVFLLVCSCQSGAGGGNEATKVTYVIKEDKGMNIDLTSTAFDEGGMIPKKYTCDGEDVSPPLSWSGIPKSTKSLALISDDPDAPVGTWVHWVIYNIPTGMPGLPENVPPVEVLPEGARQGRNSWGRIGYGGPCAPSGTHRYYFKLYALGGDLGLKPGATKEELLKAMEGQILAEGRLMGKYSRQR
jgi:Raf kinase inhibitor-like YbhB/YbcL family protein